jgi:L-ascorbate metabolism protein UlaG (beta-lactamase superfamily)
MSELVIAPEALKNIAIISSSHNHTDHLDAETLIPVLKNNPGIHFIIPEANRDFVSERVQCEKNLPIGLNDGSSVTLDGITFHGIRAKHNELEKDDHGNYKYMGYVIEFGGYAIYHSGDTLWFDGMADILQPFNIDLALLPINGNHPERKVAGNLNSRESAELGKAIRAKMIIPCHYDMFSFNTAAVSGFAEAADEIGQPYTILRGGERFDN